jgi:hypothetical protein
MFQIEVGITPLRLLTPKFSQHKLDTSPKEEGMVPDSLLSMRDRCQSLEMLPKTDGISPDILFWLKSKNSIDVKIASHPSSPDK